MLHTKRWIPWLFVAPALFLILFFLAYPTLMTIIRSFYGKGTQIFASTLDFVGLANWQFVFTRPAMIAALRNNALWTVVFTFCTVTWGLLLAVLLDRIRYEKVVKAIIFIPAAISMVGASVIWKFVYAYRPADLPQIGVINGLMVACGREPVGWLIERPWINNLALIVVGIWIWTGFCMVIFSAAYKNIPQDIIEAARTDGANEWLIFWRVIFPLMTTTIAVVTTTMIVQVLKIFDIVFVMTNGAYDTEVVANRMYKEMFNYYNYGRASAIAVVLLLLVTPIMIFNIRRFTRQEARQ